MNNNNLISINNRNLSECERFLLLLAWKHWMHRMLDDNSIQILNIDRKLKRTKNKVLSNNNLISINNWNLSEYERFSLLLRCKRYMHGISDDNSTQILNINRKSKLTKNKVFNDDNPISINDGKLSEHERFLLLLLCKH